MAFCFEALENTKISLDEPCTSFKSKVRKWVDCRTKICDFAVQLATQPWQNDWLASHFVDTAGWHTKWLPLNFGFNEVIRTAPIVRR